MRRANADVHCALVSVFQGEMSVAPLQQYKGMADTIVQ
jgi:hypothetical protein